jgi:hypothetical protein
MNRRLDPIDSLDFFPTPPWATRALLEHVIPDANGNCWEPAAGKGHMAEVLRERFGLVHASDIHDYGMGYDVGCFVGLLDLARDHAECPFHPAWIISNPPFNLAWHFAVRALHEAQRGVALLVRSNWAEGVDRYERLFRDNPPTIVAQFCERVPMAKGRWDPDGSTATSYAWFVWDRTDGTKRTSFVWIPPGRRVALEHPDDRRRFAMAPTPEGAAL